MRRKELVQMLKDNGFVLSKSGSSHEIWSRGGYSVAVSYGPYVHPANLRTMRSIIRKIEAGVVIRGYS